MNGEHALQPSERAQVKTAADGWLTTGGRPCSREMDQASTEQLPGSGARMVDPSIKREFFETWKTGPSRLRPLFKKYPAEVSAAALEELLVEAGWDFDYGPVLTEPSEQALRERALSHMSEPSMRRDNVILPVPGIEEFLPLPDPRAAPDDEDVSDPYKEGHDVSSMHTQWPHLMNKERLGRFLLPQAPEYVDVMGEGTSAYYRAIEVFESTYKTLAPWHPVLPHDRDRAGFIQPLDFSVSANAWVAETAPLLWQLDSQVYRLNFDRDFQTWFLGTGLRAASIWATFHLWLPWSESSIQRFGMRGLESDVEWQFGMHQMEDGDPAEMARSVLERSFERISRRRKVPPAPLPPQP